LWPPFADSVYVGFVSIGTTLYVATFGGFYVS
jgi:hypothetical protein